MLNGSITVYCRYQWIISKKEQKLMYLLIVVSVKNHIEELIDEM